VSTPVSLANFAGRNLVLYFYPRATQVGTVRATFLIDRTSASSHAWPKMSVAGRAQEVDAAKTL
jgi:peroxiredoxin